MLPIERRYIAALIAVLGGAAFIRSNVMYGARVAPVINDVATDLSTPGLLYKSRPSIPPLPDAFKPIIRSFYADVQPLTLQGYSVAQALELAAHVAGRMPRWTLRLTDTAASQLEGVSVTLIFRFRDDWVVRVQEDAAAPGSVRVDMRSRSRLGKGDLGANAARIKTYLARLAQAAAEGQGSAGRPASGTATQ